MKRSSCTTRSEMSIESSKFVAVPRHERDTHVLAQGQLALVDRGAIGKDVALLYDISSPDQRTLVDTGVLVGAGELGQVVDVDSRLAGVGFLVRNPNDDAPRVDAIHRAAAFCDDTYARVPAPHAAPCRCRQAAFSVRIVGTAWRCMFEPHQRPVGVVVLKKTGSVPPATETTCFGDTSM